MGYRFDDSQKGCIGGGLCFQALAICIKTEIENANGVLEFNNPSLTTLATVIFVQLDVVNGALITEGHQHITSSGASWKINQPNGKLVPCGPVVF